MTKIHMKKKISILIAAVIILTIVVGTIFTNASTTPIAATISYKTTKNLTSSDRIQNVEGYVSLRNENTITTPLAVEKLTAFFN